MIRLKSAAEIEVLAAAGRKLGQILETLKGHVKVGVTGLELDQLARELIAKAGATPAFLHYAPRGMTPFPGALCVSVNDEVVHGFPRATPFKDGDIVKIDLGLVWQSLYVDSARTVAIGNVSVEAQQLLDITRLALARGIAAAQPGKRIGDIGAAVQEYVEAASFGVVHQLVGHGVGFAVHEPPAVPNFGKAGTGTVLQPGLVIAIEPMVTVGNPDVVTDDDGWIVRTADGSLAAHEEHTIAVTEAGPRILTAA